jgi:hypothetical protein
MTQEDSAITSDVLPPTPEEISAAALDVNAATNEFGASVTQVERYLEHMNIGVPAWVRVKGWSNPEGQFWSREVGYDRFPDGWHLAIRETSGAEGWEDKERKETWIFNHAPRKSRLSAADKIPALLRELVKEADRTSRRLREKAVEVNAFAATLKIPPKNLKFVPNKTK